MKKLIQILLILGVSSCSKTETPERCSYCYYNESDKLYTYMCEDYLNQQNGGQTLEEWTEYWDSASDIECDIK